MIPENQIKRPTSEPGVNGGLRSRHARDAGQTKHENQQLSTRVSRAVFKVFLSVHECSSVPTLKVFENQLLDVDFGERFRTKSEKFRMSGERFRTDGERFRMKSERFRTELTELSIVFDGPSPKPITPETKTKSEKFRTKGEKNI
jgi:hypothetical protein